MGYIDSTTHTAVCTCGNTDQVTILEMGSQYGASWQSGKPMKTFVLEWGAVGLSGPEIVKATCNHCGAMAAIQIS